MARTPATRNAHWLVLVLLLSACLGRSPEARFFVMPETHTHVEAGSDSALSIQLASAVLPDYLARPEMVRRIDGAELMIDAQHRWAGGLEANVLRVLGAGLSARLATQLVVVHPKQPRKRVDFRIDVDFSELISVGNAVQLRARWLIDPGGKGVLATGSAVVAQPLESASAQSLVEAHTLALDTLAREIAAQVSQLAAYDQGTGEQ